MVYQGKGDTSWKEKFESQYSREQRDHMSPAQKNIAIKEILDDAQVNSGNSVEHVTHALSKDDKIVSDMISSMDGVTDSTVEVNNYSG